MSKKMIKILSIDGGGIRGIIPALVLAEIEKRTKKRISELFDVIAGTSTGGIISLALVKPSSKGINKPYYSAYDVVSLYEEEGENVFSTMLKDFNESILRNTKLFNLVKDMREAAKLLELIPGMSSISKTINETKNSITNILETTSKPIQQGINIISPKFSSEGFEKVLIKYFGETTFKECIRNTIITGYDIEKRDYTLFRHFVNYNSIDNKWDSLKLKDIAMATSAVPAFFKPVKIEDKYSNGYSFIDGGVFANNPSLCAYLETKKIYPENTEFLMVSLGTGDSTPTLSYDDAKEWGILGWSEKIIEIVLNGMGNMVHNYVGELFSYKNYYRFQIPVEPIKENIQTKS